MLVPHKTSAVISTEQIEWKDWNWAKSQTAAYKVSNTVKTKMIVVCVRTGIET